MLKSNSTTTTQQQLNPLSNQVNPPPRHHDDGTLLTTTSVMHWTCWDLDMRPKLDMHLNLNMSSALIHLTQT